MHLTHVYIVHWRRGDTFKRVARAFRAADAVYCTLRLLLIKLDRHNTASHKIPHGVAVVIFHQEQR